MSLSKTESEAKEEADEQRASRRQKALLTGKLVFGDEAFTINCKIRDLSDLGARVEVESLDFVPNNVVFLQADKLVGYETNVKWRTGKLLGLSFEKALPLNDISNARLQVLRKIAVEARTRKGS